MNHLRIMGDNLNGNLSYPAYLYDKISKANFFQRNRINSALPVLQHQLICRADD